MVVKTGNRGRKPWTVGIIGLGHVGTITRNALQIRCDIVTYDAADNIDYPLSEFSACDFLIVCVDTPSTPTGSADLSQVHAALRGLPASTPVILRSTVPPGTTDALAEKYGRQIFFWSEYIGEERFSVPTWEPLARNPFHVFGAHKSAEFSSWLDLIAETYGPLVRLCQVKPAEAETVKYMENCYFAVKTTFVNEFRRLCDALDLDWHAVREGWLMDPRVERDHSDAFKSAPGYGGHCLPKDVKALLARVNELGASMPLLLAVSTINETTIPPSL